jgi:uncharacterized protein (TIGR03086 family)
MAGPADAAVRRHPHDRSMSNSIQRSGGERSTTELIELGRDREAVAAARREGRPMDGVEQLDQIIPMLDAIVDRITPEQLGRPTPCANFAVVDVLEHMIDGATVFAPAFRGTTAAAAGIPAEDGTPQQRFHPAMADLLGAVHAPGAQDRTIAAPFREMPGSVFASYVAFDGLVHGWDLAFATGLPYTPSEALVSEVASFARQLLTPEMRDGDTFADETEAPPGSSELERLVAFSGRHVNRKDMQR